VSTENVPQLSQSRCLCFKMETIFFLSLEVITNRCLLPAWICDLQNPGIYVTLTKTCLYAKEMIHNYRWFDTYNIPRDPYADDDVWDAKQQSCLLATTYCNIRNWLTNQLVFRNIHKGQLETSQNVFLLTPHRKLLFRLPNTAQFSVNFTVEGRDYILQWPCF
jgi:hypothetical protein